MEVCKQLHGVGVFKEPVRMLRVSRKNGLSILSNMWKGKLEKKEKFNYEEGLREVDSFSRKSTNVGEGWMVGM